MRGTIHRIDSESFEFSILQLEKQLPFVLESYCSDISMVTV